MEILKLPSKFEEKEIEVIGPAYDLYTIPEEEFFALRNQGQKLDGIWPLPKGVRNWNLARYKGAELYCCKRDREMWLAGDDFFKGRSLVHYEYADEEGTRFKLYPDFCIRTLETERSLFMSSAQNLQDLINQTNAQRMNLGAAPSYPVGNGAAGDGVTSAASINRLQREALAGSYVVGYIMGAAPAITLALSKKKVKDGSVAFDITAKESKPSRCLSVLMSFPAKCVKKAGNLATPSEIMNGLVDYNTAGDERVNLCFPLKAAIGYISALGGRIPEYAPFVAPGGAREQWSKETILSEHPEVTYVRVHATEAVTKNTTAQERFRFSLKTTSPRRSLYTRNNILCLRALKHVDIRCTDEASAYELNAAAFGQWQYRKPKTENETALEKAIHAVPDQIWRKKYTIDGETVEGIGSAFFMVGSEEVNEGGVSVMKRQLSYYPWYQTGNLREDHPQPVRSMVQRTLQKAEGNKKERMVTIPIIYKDHPEDKAFAPYRAFVDFITSSGFITTDQIAAMCGRAKTTRRKDVLSSDQKDALRSFLRADDVEAQIMSVQEAAADREVLRSR